eukprot:2645243-Lingulodinium_polyedra.AAC.1
MPTPGPRSAGSMSLTGSPARTAPARSVGLGRLDPSTCLPGAQLWKEHGTLSRLRMSLSGPPL